VTDNERAAIGVGNTGGTASQHGASGRGNWIHRNHLTDNQRGIMIMLGSPDAVVEHNVITGGETRAEAGIELRNAPGTIVRSNQLSGNQHAGFWAIRLITDPGDADGNGAGDPRDILIKGNSVTGNAGGVRIDAGREIVLHRNLIAGNRINLQVDPGADVEFR
jgi:nitrous oxidase accessory protein NosD